MLHIILGKTGSGKSDWCMTEAAKLAVERKSSVLVVPEQAVYTFEREVVERLEDTAAAYVEVKSCKRLCADILSRCGGGTALRLDAAQKSVLVRRAVVKTEKRLSYYRRRTRDSAFYGMLANLFDELRNAGATPEKLRNVVSESGTEVTRQKFGEIANILEEYEKLLESGFFDDAGELRTASDKAFSDVQIKNKYIFFDGFTGFTQAEYSLIRSMIKNAREVYITLGTTGNSSEKGTATEVCYKTYENLKRLCNEEICSLPEIIELENKSRAGNKGIEAAGEYFGFGVQTNTDTEGVKIIKASDRYDEALRIADEICSLTRHGYKYGDINVIVRDTEGYRNPLKRTFERFGIPCHLDVNDTLECSPLSVILDCAVEMSSGIKTSSLMRMLKTEVCDITDEEISLLENYCFIYSIDGDSWFSPFTLNPSGLGEMSRNDTEILVKTENARNKAAGWMHKFLKKVEKAKGAELLRAAYELAEDCGAVDGMLKENAPGRRNAQLAFSMVERLYRLLGEDVDISREELRSMLKLMASSTEASTIPLVQDIVSVYDAARSLPYNPKVVFVAGMTEGVFPKESFDGLIFTLEERDLLLEKDIRLAGCFEECSDMETFYLYRAVTAPLERLYMSWSGNTGSETTSPCAELSAYIEKFSPEFLEKTAACGVVNNETAVASYIESTDENLKTALLESSAAASCTEAEEKVKDVPFVIEDKKLAGELIGNELRLSSTSLDKYEECPFKYCMNYMFSLKPLRKVSMSSAETGSLVHEVMEKLLTGCEMNLLSLNDEEIRNRVERYCTEYMDTNYPQAARTKRIESVAKQATEGVQRLALRFKEEQYQSKFRVAACELTFGNGKDDELPAVVYTLEDGSRVVFGGKIDRVDTFENGNGTHLRIVDYKTGSKEFNIEEAQMGINTQMLLYLYALEKVGKEKFGEFQPAGALYMPADPGAVSKKEESDRIYRMFGTLCDDPDVLEAMESEGEGVYIQARRKNGKWSYGCRLSQESFDKLGERMDKLITDMATSLRNGDIRAIPAVKDDEELGCKYCDYASICRKDRIIQGRNVKDTEDLNLVKGEL